MSTSELEKITFTNNEVVPKVMFNKVLCKAFLNSICGMAINEIRHIYWMKDVIERIYGEKRRSLGICVIDDEEKYYSIEMYTTNPGDIPERGISYLGVMDRAQMEKSHDFAKLKNSCAIFICLDDITGCNEAIGSFEFRSTYDNSSLDDGSKIIILNASSTELPDNALGRFLRFVKTGIPSDDFTKDLLHEVELIKQGKGLEDEYKVLEDMLNEREEKATKKFQKLLNKIPRESEEFTILLEASSDELEEFYKKYDIHVED